MPVRRHPSRRFTDAEVIEMRRRYAEGESLNAIARSQTPPMQATHVQKIVSGYMYKEVPGCLTSRERKTRAVKMHLTYRNKP